MNKTEQHKKAMLEALEKSLGVVTPACKAVGIGRTIFYEWLKTDEEFKAKVDELEGVALDFAESQLHKQIQDGVPSSTMFYLKTKGKKRGYIERQEFEHTTGEEGFTVDLSKLDDETIKKLIESTK